MGIKKFSLDLAVLLVCTLAISIIMPSIVNAEDSSPAVVSYKLISDEPYLNNNVEAADIGIIVQFDALSDINIDSQTTYAELVLADTVTAIKVDNIVLGDGSSYSPASDEILFLLKYDNDMLDGLEGIDELLVNKVVLNGSEIAVNMAPVDGYCVYVDRSRPSWIDRQIVDEQAVYRYNDSLKVKIIFNEPVFVQEADMATAVRFEIVNFDGQGGLFRDYITSWTWSEGGTCLDLSYKLNTLRADYSGIVKVVLENTKFVDIAGNSLIGHEEYEFAMQIESLYPLVTEETLYYSCLSVQFKDDDFTDQNSEVGIYLAEDRIEAVKDIDYRIYPLIDSLKYYETNDVYRICFLFTDAAFDESDGRAENWYFYYYLKDGEGHQVYHEIEDMYIYRKDPKTTFDDNYLIPRQNHIIDFTVEAYIVDHFEVSIKDMNDTVITSGWGFHLEQWDYNQEQWDIPPFFTVNLDGPTEQESVSASVDVVAMFDELGSSDHSLPTDTYKLVVGVWGEDLASSDYLYYEDHALFSIDRTAPTLDIDTIDGEQGTIKSYLLQFSDLNGQEALDPDSTALVDKKVTLFYEFVEAGLSTYDDADKNEQVIDVGQDMEIKIPYSQLTPGTYCLNVKGVDPAGNQVVGLSTETFVVLDKPTGTIVCDQFTNNELLNIDFNLSRPSENLMWRAHLDNADGNSWPQDWAPLIHDNGSGLLTADLNAYNASLQEGEHTLYFQYGYQIDDIFYESDVLSDTFIFDVTGPTADISYSTEDATYEPVTATLTQWGDNYSALENIVLASNSEVQLATADETYTFVLLDEAGNKSEFVAQADWIIGEAKPATIVYSTTAKTQDNVTVYLDFEAMDEQMAQINLLMDGLDPAVVVETTADEGYQLFTFKQNGNYTFEYIDDMGKTGYVTAFINNIDRTPPTGEISYSSTSLTSKNVYGYVRPTEAVEYQIYDEDNNLLASKQVQRGSVIRHAFTQNGTVTILLEDKAGNQQSYVLLVDWIDKEPPSVSIAYSDNYYDISTKKAVTATVTADEPILILNNHQQYTRTFTENAEYTFIVEDLAGNSVEVDVIVTNIKSDPVLTFTYSTLEPTNTDVVVTLISDEPITILNNNGSNQLVFTENGVKYFKLEDESGTIIHQFAEVTWIDKEAPVMSFEESNFLYANVGENIDLASGFRIVDNTDGVIDSYTVDDNVDSQTPGTYTAVYTFADVAGNSNTVTRTVEVLTADSITIVINGVKATDSTIPIPGAHLNIDVFGTRGLYELQYKKGSLPTGIFKTNKQHVINKSVEVNQAGYITLYIQDQERNWKLVKCYMLN